MTTSEAIAEALRLADISGNELSKRLGHNDNRLVRRWLKDERGMRIYTFVRILDVCELSGGYDGQRGWWVARPEDVRLPDEAG